MPENERESGRVGHGTFSDLKYPANAAQGPACGDAQHGMLSWRPLRVLHDSSVSLQQVFQFHRIHGLGEM
jgi:hypothetical protein